MANYTLLGRVFILNDNDMDSKKMIKFLEYLGIEDKELFDLVNSLVYDLTETILNMLAETIGEDFETVKMWYLEFTY